jgi:hypothetical protein
MHGSMTSVTSPSGVRLVVLAGDRSVYGAWRPRLAVQAIVCEAEECERRKASPAGS